MVRKRANGSLAGKAVARPAGRRTGSSGAGSGRSPGPAPLSRATGPIGPLARPVSRGRAARRPLGTTGRTAPPPGRARRECPIGFGGGRRIASRRSRPIGSPGGPPPRAFRCLGADAEGASVTRAATVRVGALAQIRLECQAGAPGSKAGATGARAGRASAVTREAPVRAARTSGAPGQPPRTAGRSRASSRAPPRRRCLTAPLDTTSMPEQ